MTPPKDVSIKVGDVTLSTANVPKGGIDLNQLNGESRRVLSVFDTNRDGKLSRTEMNNAIIKLANADKTHSEEHGDQIITTKKNGKLEEVEVQNLNYEVSSYNPDELDRYEAETRQFINELKNRQMSSERDREEAIAKQEMILEGISNKRQQKHTATVSDIRHAAKIIQREYVIENEIKNNGLQRTYNENWLKDTEGNHYRYNGSTMKFEKIANVEFIGEDGSYRTRTKNVKGQQVVRTFTKNYSNNGIIKSRLPDDKIIVLNSEGKVYVNPDYAAKVAGLETIPGGYKAEDGSLFVWNEEKHIFLETDTIIGTY